MIMSFFLCVHAHTTVYLWRSEDSLGNQFLLYTTWISGIELRSSGLALSAFTPETACWHLNLEKKRINLHGNYYCCILQVKNLMSTRVEILL